MLSSRSDEAHSSNVVSSEAALIQLPSQSQRKLGTTQENATVVLASKKQLRQFRTADPAELGDDRPLHTPRAIPRQNPQ